MFIHGRSGKTEMLAWDEEDRYPPLPSTNGFNVFGPLTSLTLDGAQGALVIGDQTHDLGAGAAVKLDGVKGLTNSRGDALVPLPFATAGRTAGLQFQAVSHVHINGVAGGSFMQRLADVVTAGTFAATIAAAVFSLIALLMGLGKAVDRPRTRR